METRERSERRDTKEKWVQWDYQVLWESLVHKVLRDLLVLWVLLDHAVPLVRKENAEISVKWDIEGKRDTKGTLDCLVRGVGRGTTGKMPPVPWVVMDCPCPDVAGI